MSALPKGGDYQLGAYAIPMMPMKDIKGLEFPGVERMLAPPGDDENEVRRVGAKRATNSLVVTVIGAANLGRCCRHRGVTATLFSQLKNTSFNRTRKGVSWK